MDQRTLDSKRYPIPFSWNKKASRINRFSMVILILIFISGCMNMKFKAGKQIDPGVIEKTLHLKESTTNDVKNPQPMMFGMFSANRSEREKQCCPSPMRHPERCGPTSTNRGT